MFCGNCGTQIKEGAKFCPNCGWAVPVAPVQAGAIPEPIVEKPVDTHCGNCGAALKKGSAFCGECGTATSNLHMQVLVSAPIMSSVAIPHGRIVAPIPVPTERDLSLLKLLSIIAPIVYLVYLVFRSMYLLSHDNWYSYTEFWVVDTMLLYGCCAVQSLLAIIKSGKYKKYNVFVISIISLAFYVIFPFIAISEQLGIFYLICCLLNPLLVWQLPSAVATVLLVFIDLIFFLWPIFSNIITLKWIKNERSVENDTK
ncbi:MAG: zinc ribbon domain-containing protein [Spirochaetaceae bacterium]|jgi:RNA polymerase subunit RPABC4/transcription elongation factor Spt4|nr:zinc ribbon domain-containing protein [Spirochaetaceae bacterium]